MRLPSYGSAPNTSAPLPGRGDEVDKAAGATRNDSYLSYINDDVKTGSRFIRRALILIADVSIYLLISGQYTRRRSLLVDRLTFWRESL